MSDAVHGRIAVFGAGYVGILTAAGLAELGRSAVLYDTDTAKIELLRAGGLPIHEAGLPELVARGVAAGRLAFTADPAAALKRLRCRVHHREHAERPRRRGHDCR